MKKNPNQIYQNLSLIDTFKYSNKIWELIHDPALVEGIEDYLKHGKGYAETDNADFHECYYRLSRYFYNVCNSPDGASTIDWDLSLNKEFWEKEQSVKSIVRWIARYHYLIELEKVKRHIKGESFETMLTYF